MILHCKNSTAHKISYQKKFCLSQNCKSLHLLALVQLIIFVTDFKQCAHINSAPS